MSEAPKAQVLRLDSLVDYQGDAVVSRQITRTDAGNVTLFSFDAGQELSPHTAPYDALAHILEGTAEIEVAGRVMQVEAGEAVIMPANEPHAVKARQRMKMLLTMMRG